MKLRTNQKTRNKPGMHKDRGTGTGAQEIQTKLTIAITQVETLWDRKC